MSFSQQPSLNLSDRNSDTLSHAADAQIPLSLKNGPRRVRRGNLFLDLPIAGRLAIGFLIAALVAALAAGNSRYSAISVFKPANGFLS
ncbi:MAG TPA: hypothetical protein VFN35_11125 [Ktedonobacteraceae bacterium]|nr:hypothetical protein [Ktedonobacteraceae bacterium]